MTPAPDHSEDRGTEQPRLEVEQEAETLEHQESQEAAQEAEGGEEEEEEEDTASVPGPGDQ